MKTLKTLKLFILILFIPVAVAAQNGSVTGVVKDRKSNETLIGTTVAIEGTTL
jgi:hypothetical protein